MCLYTRTARGNEYTGSPLDETFTTPRRAEGTQSAANSARGDKLRNSICKFDV